MTTYMLKGGGEIQIPDHTGTVTMRRQSVSNAMFLGFGPGIEAGNADGHGFFLVPCLPGGLHAQPLVGDSAYFLMNGYYAASLPIAGQASANGFANCGGGNHEGPTHYGGQWR